jgi:hypothetical protein
VPPPATKTEQAKTRKISRRKLRLCPDPMPNTPQNNKLPSEQ